MSSESKSSPDCKDEKTGDKNVVSASSEAKAHVGHEKASAKDDDESNFDPENNDLVNKVISFFFDNDEFAHTFETFAEMNCHAFDLDSDEMKLEYTDIYNKFLALFEEKLEGKRTDACIREMQLTGDVNLFAAYIQSQGATIQEFYELVRRAYEVDRQSGTVLCSEILVATCDFDVFVLMMRQTKEAAMLAKR